jgi:hypothetical protein
MIKYFFGLNFIIRLGHGLGLWFMGSWFMVHGFMGSWFMVHGSWFMVHGSS